MLLFELPSLDDPSNWQKKKALVVPLGVKDIKYDDTMPKEAYIEIDYGKVEIDIAFQQSHSFANNIQAQKNQYELKHCVISTIHDAMGETL